MEAWEGIALSTQNLKCFGIFNYFQLNIKYREIRRKDMNKLIMTITAKPGKMPEIIAGAKSIVEYLKSNHGLKGEAYLQIFGGTAGTIYFIGDHDDIGSAQAAQAKLMADKEYWALAQKFSEFVIAPPSIMFLQQI